jgi:hypothetical protein
MLAKCTVNLKPVFFGISLWMFTPVIVATKTHLPVSGKLPMVFTKSDVKP